MLILTAILVCGLDKGLTLLCSILHNFSVCNWPWASAPCEEPEEVTEAETGDESSGEDEEDGDSDKIIVAPSFGFECPETGMFAHESNCQKFWLCKGECYDVTMIFPTAI